MADNSHGRLIPYTVIEHLALVVVAILSASYSLAMAMFMFIIAILHPSTLSEATVGGTTHIRIDLNLDHGPPPEQNLRRGTHHNQPRRPSPHPAGHTRRYPPPQPTADPEHSLPPTPSPGQETPPRNVQARQPIHLHTIQPGNIQHTASVQQTEEHLPPSRPIVESDSENESQFSYDEPLPPARPGDVEFLQYTRRPHGRPSLRHGAPLHAEDQDEPLPVYERPPDYDAENGGSQ